MNDTTLPIPKKQPSIPKPRRKKGLRKGFALHDWKRLLLSSNDLAQRKGQPLRNITMKEIKLHNKVHDGWIALHGKVYNIGPYLHYHPGGVDIFDDCLGGDASKLFDQYHRWVNIENLIGPLIIGYLIPDVNSDDDDDDDNGVYKIPSALTTSANGMTYVSPFSMQPPKPVKVKPQMMPSLLQSTNNDKEKDDDNIDLNP
mmetsp:Transcript_26273/g.32403  ORF Transcript_26273/g.32403 Transcript_26273/m.32403 type:complete len:200 (+) Transcript_26273:226-825(+)